MADRDKEFQDILVCDDGLDILDSIGFRGVPQKTIVTAKDDILK